MSNITSMYSDQSPPERIRIILASCYPLILQALKINLEKQQDMEIVAETGNSEEAINLSTRLHPDIVIIDIDMPHLDGLETIKQIFQKSPGTQAILLTLDEDNEQIQRAKSTWYLPKRAPIELFFRTIRNIASGKTVSSEEFIPDIIIDYKEDMYDVPKSPLSKPDKLTVKEMAILKLLVKGKSNKEIADSLSMSVVSIKANLTRLFAKMGVRSRTEAIISSIKSGVIKFRDIR